MPLVDRKTAAAALEISRQRLEKLIKDGRIIEGPNGIDLAKAEKGYLESLDPAKRAGYLTSGPAREARRSKTNEPDPETDDDLLSFADARTVKERVNAKRAELEYNIRANLYVHRDEIAAKEFAIARKIRDRIVGFPARLANLVPADAMKIITDECEALVREMQDDVATIAETTSQG